MYMYMYLYMYIYTCLHICISTSLNPIYTITLLSTSFSKDGFVDGNGGPYNPNILRVGGGKTARVQAVSLEDTLDQEQFTYSTEKDRMAALNHFNEQVDALIRDIEHMQALLMNMGKAFALHLLPDGWELRVAMDSAQVFV